MASMMRRFSAGHDAPPLTVGGACSRGPVSPRWRGKPAAEMDGLTGSSGGGLQRLEGCELPTLLFAGHDRRGLIDLAALADTALVLYVYPGSGTSRDLALDALQHETYRRLRRRFSVVVPDGAIVALSSLTRDRQFVQEPRLAFEQIESQEFPHHLIADETCHLAQILGLPTFECDGRRFYERVTIIAHDRRIVKVAYPADPLRDGEQALAWLGRRQLRGVE